MAKSLHVTDLAFLKCVLTRFLQSSLRLKTPLPWTVAPRLLYPWDFPGKNTGVGCHFLLQGIFLTQELNPHLPNVPTAGGLFTH